MSSGEDADDRRIGRADVVRQVFEELPVILGAVAGPEHRYIASNAAHRELLRHTDFIGEPMLAVNPEWRGQEVQVLMDLAYRTGTVQHASQWRVQIADPADGSVRDAYLDTTLVPRRDAAGRVAGINSYTFDVTELVLQRQRAEQRAAEAQERYLRTSDEVKALQRALLPAGLPILPDAELAAAYLLAQRATAAGGDWFDALRIPDGRAALVVGDVVGNGVAASAIMGQLRAVLHERLSAGADLAESLAAAERMAAELPGARAATVCVALLDTATGALQYCTAGHPPPLLLPAAGQARFLQPSGGAPLGVGGPLHIAQARIDPAGTLLLYSDGILERPGRIPEESLDELANAASGILAAASAATGAPASPDPDGTNPVPAEQLCRSIVELLVRETGYSDDITVLACRRVHPAPPLQTSGPATAGTVAQTRAALRGWLRRCTIPEPMAMLVLHAAGELVSNAVLHAYAAAPDRGRAHGAVRLRASLDAGGVLEVAVSDRGRWREPDLDRHRVHGLDMVGDLADALAIDSGAHGTRATAWLAVARAARMLDPAFHAEVAPGPQPGDDTLLIMRHADDTGMALVLDGPLDIQTTEALRQESLRALLQQPAALHIDLSRVSVLSSAGVAVLHEIRDRAAGSGTSLRLVAQDDSVAAFVLDLVRMPRATALR